MLSKILTFLGAGRVRMILGASCAVACFFGGYWIKSLSSDKVIAQIKEAHAQQTANALEAVRKEQEDEIATLKERIKTLGEVLTKRETTIADLRLSWSDLDVQLNRLRESVKTLKRNPAVDEIRTAGNSCNACLRAHDDLKRLAREGADLLAEGTELHSEIARELGTVLADRDAVREITAKK